MSNLGCLLHFQFKTSQNVLKMFINCNKHTNQHFIQHFYLTIALHEHMAAGLALAIGRAGDCIGPRTLRRGLHNITHPLYASPPVKTDINTSLIVH